MNTKGNKHLKERAASYSLMKNSHLSFEGSVVALNHYDDIILHLGQPLEKKKNMGN